MSGLKDSPIRIKSFQFACEIVLYCDELKKNKDYELASQLLSSGTSIGANTREAQRVLVLGISKINLELLLKKLMKLNIGWKSWKLPEGKFQKFQKK
jgi:hypothetical protein